MLETVALPPHLEFETVDCDLCGSDDFAPWDHARSNQLTRCRNCGLTYTNPRLANASDKAEHLYAAAYFNQKSNLTDKLIEARRISYGREIAYLERHRKHGRILDVGCGTGVFLQCFGTGWEKHGCDVSGYALKAAENRGVLTSHGEFERLPYTHDSFDVVYFRASLHHAYSPSACLDKAHKVLRSGGIVAVTMTNNHSGPAGRLFGAHVRSYEQAHNYLFSTETLRRYLVDAGFTVFDHSYPYFQTNYGSLSDLVDLFRAYRNFRSLKRRGQLNRAPNLNFSSPPFYGNYVNMYARKR